MSVGRLATLGTAVIALVCAAPANAAFSASLTGTTATFTGDNNFNQFAIRGTAGGCSATAGSPPAIPDS